jgi:5-methylcytosine-specific restriction endonuclease McrA
MPTRVVVCARCARSFQTNRGNQKWCSRTCAPRRSHKTSTERGMGIEHQRRRAELLPKAYGTSCPLCGRVMLRGQVLHLDHTVPRSKGGTVGDRIVHGPCNVSRGNGTTTSPLLQRMRNAPPPAPITSRVW